MVREPSCEQARATVVLALRANRPASVPRDQPVLHVLQKLWVQGSPQFTECGLYRKLQQMQHGLKMIHARIPLFRLPAQHGISLKV